MMRRPGRSPFRMSGCVSGNSRSVGVLLLFVAAGLFLLLFFQTDLPRVRAASRALASGDPEARCATCHAEIVSSYRKTAMARGSGSALEGLLQGGFLDSSSGIHYQVFKRDGAAWMSYTRPATSPLGALQGEQRLQFFVGSGHRGRTFLYQQQGLWFELPINYYTRRAAWEMAPNYGGLQVLPAPLQVDANCLHCHTTGVAQKVGPARNALPDPPFTQGGIGCVSCHGDPSLHLATNGHGPILNPDKLGPERRDSACIQCHLEGDAVVYRAGHSLAQFQPGDRLSDLALYFVRASQAGGGSRATSQYEALLQSACKRASGDRLTCTTCHDPHSSPSPAQRVSFYRARCLACHSSTRIATEHHPEQQDCASCHMPTRDTADISHEQVTDHDIQSRPLDRRVSTLEKSGDLVPVGGFPASDRDLGLAYAQMAQRGDRAAGRRALELLTKAKQAGVADEQLSLNLGFLYQVSGAKEQAGEEYRLALKASPYEPAALANLAVLQASAGHLEEAKKLLETLLSADPSQASAGINLAQLQCGTGQAAEAQTTVRRLQQMNPDAPIVRGFLQVGCAIFRSTAAR